MINAKTDKEKQNLLKSKIITKIWGKIELDGKEDMEEIQSEVAQELNEQAGVEIEKANNVVRLVVAEFIENSKGVA